MRDDRHSGRVRFARDSGEEISPGVLVQLHAIGFALERGNGLPGIRRSFHRREIAAGKCAALLFSIRFVSDGNPGTEIEAWAANLSGVQSFFYRCLPRQRIPEVEDGRHAMREKHFAHVGAIVNV